MEVDPSVSTVRKHRRRTSSGRHTVVKQHQRRDLPHQYARKVLNRTYRDPHPYRGVVRVQRAGRNLRNAWKYNKRKRRVAAASVGLFGIAELVAWLLLRGVGVVATAIVAVLGGVAAVTMSRTATDATQYGGGHRKSTGPDAPRPTKSTTAGRHRRA